MLVKTVQLNLFAKNYKLHKFATTNSIFLKNRAIQTCIIVKRIILCKSIFSKIGLVDQSNLCTQIYWQKIASCINLQIPIVIKKKKKYFRQASSDNVHKYFNFHPNRVSNQSKLCTQIYLQKQQLHKFATTNSNF